MNTALLKTILQAVSLKLQDLKSYPTYFTNCIFTNLDGGDTIPINLVSDDFVFEYSNFTLNKKGTVIISGPSNTTFKYCIFENNHNNNQINMNFCIFTENVALNYGGSIYALNAEFLSLKKRSFSLNSAKANGGALFYNGKKIDIFRCQFTQNSCYDPNNDNFERESSRGGSIFLSISRDSTIESCNFQSSSAKSYGGALFVQYTETKESNACNIFDCVFIDCFTNLESESEGGAISCRYGRSKGSYRDGDMAIENCIFEKSRAANGGAIYFNDGTEKVKEHKTIKSFTFINCSSTESDGYGYAIYSKSYEFELISNSFTDLKPYNQKKLQEKNSIIYIEINEEGKSPVIDSITFEENTGVSGIILDINSQVEMTNLLFRKITDFSPCINLDDWRIKERVNILNN